MGQITNCRICNQSIETKRLFDVKEMMFGFREEFKYFQCSNCQCVQIVDNIADLSAYYPKDYFKHMSESLWPIPDWSATMGAASVNFQEVYATLGTKDWEAIITNKVIDNYIKRANITMDASILDVGAADGLFLLALRKVGFSGRLLGIDPYKEEMHYESGVSLKSMTIFELSSQPLWDLITFNHSFEHMMNPIKTLRAAAERLGEDGICLIRVPVVPSYAWNRYGVHWVGIDAPRHYFIPSIKSMTILAEEAGLVLFDTFYDSTALQFWASEQYARNIPFYDESSWAINPLNSKFSFAQMGVFERRAHELNAKGQGDQAVFYLRKKVANAPGN